MRELAQSKAVMHSSLSQELNSLAVFRAEVTEKRTSPPGAQKGDPGAHICAPPSSS